MKRTLLGLIAMVFLLTGCVKQDAQVVLQKIAIEPDTIRLAIGESQKISPVFTPETFSSIAVEWKSADTTVASFSRGGYISAKKTGKIRISVKDKNSATSGSAVVIIY